MQITFLGTAAATSYPLTFCKCEYCREARRQGGKNLRKRSSVIINNDLLIDLGPDLMAASFMHRKSIAGIQHCLQTHPHSDHFDPSHLSTRVPEYGGIDMLPLEIYASRATLNRMSEMLRAEGYVGDLFDLDEQRKLKAKVVPVDHFDRVKAGSYSILCMPSDHDRSVDSLIYAISDDSFSILYATDTDTLRDDVLRNLQEAPVRFDLIVLDHTYGPGADGEAHLNSSRFVREMARLKQAGLLAGGARFLATHISHEGNPPHDALSAYAASLGYEIAYDGLCIDLSR